VGKASPIKPGLFLIRSDSACCKVERTSGGPKLIITLQSTILTEATLLLLYVPDKMDIFLPPIHRSINPSTQPSVHFHSSFSVYKFVESSCNVSEMIGKEDIIIQFAYTQCHLKTCPCEGNVDLSLTLYYKEKRAYKN
ncbi:hypothetical protein STEG23_013043, partial [Scotinomys teguina]